MGNGSRCYPLTITDTYSRFLIEVKAMDGPKFEGTKRAMTRAFEEYGTTAAVEDLSEEKQHCHWSVSSSVAGLFVKVS